MMSKRRQTLGIQIIATIATLGLVAYLFFPKADIKLADNWYQDITGFEPHASHQEAALAAVYKQMSPTAAPNHLIPNPNRVKAAFVILARNSDLNGIRSSIRQMEDRFNRKFNYPYVFLNEENFTDEFKEKTSSLTNSETHYGKIDTDMWGYPDHVNETKAGECRQMMQDKGIIYGGSESYRHMCR